MSTHSNGHASSDDVSLPPQLDGTRASKLSNKQSARDQKISKSYRTQSYRFSVSGIKYELGPTKSSTAQSSDPNKEIQALLPLHFISAWHPNGGPSTLEACQQSAVSLEEDLARKRLPHIVATTIAKDQSWFEGSMGVQGLTNEEAVEIGLRHGQAAITRWDLDGIHVLPTGLVSIQPASFAYQLVQLAKQECPVRKFGTKGEKCVLHGGPWTSASMTAAVIWTTRRRIALSLLGCDACADGKDGIYGPSGALMGLSGGVIILKEVFIESRYAGYGFGEYVTGL